MKRPHAWNWEIIKRPLFLVALVFFPALNILSPLGVGAEETNARPTNRFLLIVDTSRGMERRSLPVLQTVQELLASGMQGQLRADDTLGVWSFNQEVFAGRFPLQHWSPERQSELSARVLTFLKQQPYENQSILAQVLPPLLAVIQKSKYLTVILISDGAEPVHGTPFDQDINRYYSYWADRQRKANMPLVTVFRAQDGRIIDFTVNPAPWQVEFPPLPVELRSPLAVSPKTDPVSPAQPSVVPPVTRAVNEVPAPASVSLEKRPEPTVASLTNSIAQVEPLSPPDVATNRTEPAKPQVLEPPVAVPSSISLEPATNATLQAQELVSHESTPTPKPKLLPRTNTPATLPRPIHTAQPTSPQPRAPVSVATVQGAFAPTPGLKSVWIGFWIGAVVLPGLWVTIFYLMRRRRGRAQRVSLITRSFEREKF